MNVQMPGGLDGITGPRFHKDAYEQSAQHRKHMEEILQFISQWKLAATNTYQLGEEEATQLWTWTQLKADEEGQEHGQEGEGAVRHQLDYCLVTPSVQAAAWVHPRRLVLPDHQQET